MADEKFHCDACDKDFAGEEGLKQHNRDKHGIGKEKKEIIKTGSEDRDKAIEKAIRRRKTMRMIKYIIPVILIIAVVAVAIVYIPESPGNDGDVPLGPAGSTHVHADYAIYLNGDKVDTEAPSFFAHEPRTHMHQPHVSLIHIHATGVTMGRFMSLIGFPFNSTCITADGNELCNEGGNELKFYVNGELNFGFNQYVLKDQNKILISYGNETEEELQEQLDSVTDLGDAASRGLIGG